MRGGFPLRKHSEPRKLCIAKKKKNKTLKKAQTECNSPTPHNSPPQYSPNPNSNVNSIAVPIPFIRVCDPLSTTPSTYSTPSKHSPKPTQSTQTSAPVPGISPPTSQISTLLSISKVPMDMMDNGVYQLSDQTWVCLIVFT